MIYVKCLEQFYIGRVKHLLLLLLGPSGPNSEDGT